MSQSSQFTIHYVLKLLILGLRVNIPCVRGEHIPAEFSFSYYDITQLVMKADNKVRKNSDGQTAFQPCQSFYNPSGQAFWRVKNNDLRVGYWPEKWQNCFSEEDFTSDTYIKYNKFRCICKPFPTDGNYYYANEFDILRPCTKCQAGSRTTCGNKDKGKCVNCETGKYNPSEGFTCKNCEIGKYASNTNSTTCVDCLACPDKQKNEACMKSDERNNEGSCVCIEGYYKPPDSLSCQPVPKGIYKYGYGDTITLDNSAECIQIMGPGSTTINTGSHNEDDCVCKQNWQLKSGKCEQCSFIHNTPYNPINGPEGCRACKIFEYWNDNLEECTPLERLSFSFSSQFNIINTDKYRPKGELMINQRKSLSLPSNHYLDIETHQHKRCLPCQAPFHEREACGEPRSIENQKRSMWVRWIDGNNIPRENKLTIPIPDDDSQGFNSYNWWQYAHNNLNLTIIREGRCRRCSECPQGKYQTKCFDESNSGCQSCIPSNKCSPDEYYYHNHSNYEGQESNREWKGGCERSPNIAQEPYECRPCRTWTREGDKYYLLLTCGLQGPQKRWDPNNVEDNLLSEMEQNNTDQNKYSAYKHRISYCAPGWYVDLEDDQCPLDTDHEHNTPWNKHCCKKCGNSNSVQLKKASDYTPCTGHTVRNTETYTDRCENGYYSEKSNGIEVCKACTTC